MGKTSYIVNDASGSVNVQAFDNPAFIITERQTGPVDHQTTITSQVTPASLSPHSKEIPDEPGDVIKLLLLLTFIVASFVVGVVVTGTNV